VTSSQSVPALDARGLGLDIDLDATHALRGQQHRVLERSDGRRVVAGCLRGDREAVRAGPVDDRDDVRRVGGKGDESGALVDRQVPGATSEVPALVGGHDDIARQDGGELVGGNGGVEHLVHLHGGRSSPAGSTLG